ncbi:serine/threonine-protein phosphatase [Sulfitobacter sp. M57]|nr:serine/threonine-protein phosphatase [Sulfitobacter sp. KE5]MDF3423628.1 serine/threonine-protein phosphatase [Sulfitobacter sp. KE43]MDF3434570.1 serine/threonine-protein phosphatase [Sulfitobacter sp. KE42]MDF3460334.1 serine/threonine-protein phosphatase [Sulfitobacter sp. S74]MDF3464108.1 serine/threonine-protein phosphatase [Sulfitobacter sp. Ks18]MDF3468217.1 serine/threonine-protein phosphatase [Sulfitobacter sp. M05]MDF3471903.1 serine/threonine-protein phosphatase [Sulfitobacter s
MAGLCRNAGTASTGLAFGRGGRHCGGRSVNRNDFFTFETGQGSDVGCKRKVNEDSYLSRPEYGLWVVADGMGGHAAGDFASQTIVHELNSIGVAVSADDLVARFDERLTRANDIIRAQAAALEGGMIGATVAALLVHQTRFDCIWSGDSRLYLLRGGQLTQQSRDHTEARALLDAGSITAEEAQNWPRKNVITQAIGVSDKPLCERVSGELQLGDLFLICSDGLTEHIADAEIAETLLRYPPQDASAELINETVRRGARDNVTVIVIRCSDAPPPAEDEMLYDLDNSSLDTRSVL